MEPAPLFDAQQPPRRRWVWGVGSVVIAVVIGGLIYFSVSKSSVPAPVAPMTAEGSKSANVVDAATAEKKSGHEAPSSQPTLPDAITASADGMMRYELHAKLLTSSNELSSILDEWQKGGTVPPDSLTIIESAKEAVRSGANAELLPADVRQTVASQLNSIEFQNQLEAIKVEPGARNRIVSVANALNDLTGRLKAQSDAYYMSQIKALMKRSPLPLGERLDIASQYLSFNDPAISGYVARWLRDIQSGDTGSLVVSAEDRDKAIQLLARIEEGGV
ncbi:MAG TPA: hypothetical protein DIT13_05700 [Verrucomicrobiales bacterium]|nr:hypothetical protein [Verrucomicrobiales bacterium]